MDRRRRWWKPFAGTIHQIEPNRAVFDVMPLEEHLSDAYAENRLRTILLTLFAMTAVSLACVGIFGTLSYFVTVRRREIGLRLALGAVRRQIATRYLLQGLRVAAIGCASGLGLAAVMGRLLSDMLFGVSSFDGLTVAACHFAGTDSRGIGGAGSCDTGFGPIPECLA